MTPQDLLALGERLREAGRTDPEPTWTLRETRLWLNARLEDGVSCPCCAQHAQRYRRKLNSGMARALIALYWQTHDREPGAYVRVPNLVRELRVSPELGKLKWWCLAEDKEHTPGEKKASGLWRLTSQGREFVHGRIKVPRYALVYNNQLERLEGEPWGVRDALGDRFDYSELMSGSPIGSTP